VNTVLITGAAGGIGRALCEAFAAAGWRVIATDQPGSAPVSGTEFVPADLARLAGDAEACGRFAAEVRARTQSQPLAALVNNAAVQRLNPTEAVTAEDWEASLAVNLVAPFRLAQVFLPDLEAARGSVINIASIHATQTKPGFVVYATTKAALAGLTRALAVDLGGRVRVNAICPAAIRTPMLEAGFAGRPEARRQLDAFHPAGRIGEPAEVARLAVFLASGEAPFLTGAALGIDGALSARLHDPV
jgi:NAD(P)-dependent dehydrogenase (short-subunit alcohol dehydrogenase family)